MILAGLVEMFLGVAAAQRSLEDIATPLTAEETEQGQGGTGDRSRDQLETTSSATGSSRRVYH